MSPPHEQQRPARAWMTRLMWFVLLWVAGVAAVGAAAWVIRALLL